MKSWIEVSELRLRKNVSAIRAAAGEDAEVLAVIKADGYGHGAELIAPVLVDAGVTWLGVDDVDEGARVRRALGQRDARVMTMCGMEPEDADRIVEHRLTPVIWTPPHVEALEGAGERAGQRVAVHVWRLTAAWPGKAWRRARSLSGSSRALRDAKWLRLEGSLQPPELV